MRLIIYTGKGGVGKTSTSAATAYRLSELGYRTILMSTDSAHSLGDSLDVKLGPEIVNIKENLDVLEIDIIHEMKTQWADIQNYISAFMISQGMGDISAEEMAIMPGMEMISALFYVNTFNREDRYDVVVMDTAPTGETLRLMSFPDITNWYIDKAFGMIKRIVGIARATVGKIMDVPLPSKEVMDSIDVIKKHMEDVKEILENPKLTTVRLVLNPEKMVIRETMRAYTYLSLFNKNVDALVVNRVLPEDSDLESTYFAEKMAEQKDNMETIHQAFDPMKIMMCTYMRTELRGEEKLHQMAREIYGDGDPTEVYSDSSPLRFESSDGIDRMIMKMPFVSGGDIDLFRIDTSTLMIHVGSQKCNVQLPDSLIGAEILGAEFKNDELIISLRRDKNGIQR
jgi:arsenite-transporting ATPase